MSSPPEAAAPVPRPLAGPALLERAVGYTRGCLAPAARTPLDAPTPCSRWDLLDLLRHLDDSLGALIEAAETGYVDLLPVAGAAFDRLGPDDGRVLVGRLRARACTLLAAWAPHPRTRDVSVSGLPLGTDMLAAAGALEVAVHGWDVARACGVDRPLPAALARDLLVAASLLVGDADRPARFAPPLDVPAAAPPGARLLALLGRR